MPNLQLLHIKLTDAAKSVSGIYEIIFLGIILIGSMALSLVSENHIIQSAAGVVGGFILGLLIVKLPSIIAYFKDRRAKSLNQ